MTSSRSRSEPTPDGTHHFEEIIDVPAVGQTEAEAERPRRRDIKPATADNLLSAFRRCHN